MRRKGRRRLERLERFDSRIRRRCRLRRVAPADLLPFRRRALRSPRTSQRPTARRSRAAASARDNRPSTSHDAGSSWPSTSRQPFRRRAHPARRRSRPAFEIIKERVTSCSAVDAPWWTASTPALLAPGTVTYACSGVFGLSQSPTLPCTSDASCSGLASKCAIDQCVAKAPVGSACASTESCLDGAVCLGGKCSPSPDVMEKGACETVDDCRLGLVCVKGVCLPSRDFPELASRPRFSPYRVGADTCRAYTYL